MSIIQVGDRVEYTGHLTPTLKGATGTVIEVVGMIVEWDGSPIGTRNVTPRSLTLIPTKEPSKHMSSYNLLQKRILKHLSTGSAERFGALADLQSRGALDSIDEAQTTIIVERYLTDNPQGFCDGGIQRFRKATGIQPKPKAKTMRIILDLAVEGVNDDFGINGMSDYGLAGDIVEHLRNAELNGRKITQVAWRDYEAGVDHTVAPERLSNRSSGASYMFGITL